MLEEKDFQAIGQLLDEKLNERFKVQEEGFDKKLEEKFDEMGVLVNKGFTGVQEQINGLKKEIKLRPTKKEIFEWADERILSLELSADRHDYLHINELDKLPPQSEISRALAENGVKRKMA